MAISINTNQHLSTHTWASPMGWHNPPKAASLTGFRILPCFKSKSYRQRFYFISPCCWESSQVGFTVHQRVFAGWCKHLSSLQHVSLVQVLQWGQQTSKRMTKGWNEVVSFALSGRIDMEIRLLFPWQPHFTNLDFFCPHWSPRSSQLLSFQKGVKSLSSQSPFNICSQAHLSKPFFMSVSFFFSCSSPRLLSSCNSFSQDFCCCVGPLDIFPWLPSCPHFPFLSVQ